MNRETPIMQRIQIAASKLGWRLWRNNVGLAWTGVPYQTGAPETVLLRKARRIRFGLVPGSSDLIGFKLVTVTPDMVGSIIAVFAAIEVKTRIGKLSEAQQNFIDTVQRAGGYAAMMRSASDLPPSPQ